MLAEPLLPLHKMLVEVSFTGKGVRLSHNDQERNKLDAETGPVETVPTLFATASVHPSPNQSLHVLVPELYRCAINRLSVKILGEATSEAGVPLI
jgi:hypothetical protein